MAIDPRIAMGAQAPNLQSSIGLFQNTLNNIQNRKMNDQTMAQNKELQPLRVEQAQQGLDINQGKLDTNRQNELIRSIVDFSPTLKPLLESGNNMGAMQALQVRKQDLQRRGVDTTQTDEAIQAIMNGNPDDVLQSLNTAESEAVNRGLVGGASQNKFAPTVSGVQVDPNTGQQFVIQTDRNTGAAKRVDVEGAVTATPSQRRDREAESEVSVAQMKSNIEIRKSQVKDANQIAKDTFIKIPAIKAQLRTIENAIKSIDKGGSTGFMQNFFPSFRSETLDLQNSLNQMGLDVVSATTFGALSEGELRLAMDVAAPRSMQPEALKSWLIERQGAKKKLIREMEKMSSALGGNMTVKEYLDKNATFAEEEEETPKLAEGGLDEVLANDEEYQNLLRMKAELEGVN